MSTAGIHAGWTRADTHRALTPPIYASSAYAQTSHSSLRALFERRADGFAYSRSGNPTTEVLEQRITALEGGIGAIAVASGASIDRVPTSNSCWGERPAPNPESHHPRGPDTAMPPK